MVQKTDTPRPTDTYIPPAADVPGHAVVMGRPTPTTPPKKDGWRSIASTIGVLLLAPVIALLLTMFVFQSYQVEGPSMEPTLHHNDRLLVWKLPRTWARITGGHYIPARGDIVIFTEPQIEFYGQEPDKQLIKRVIGLPGERVIVKNGTITVYNDENPSGFHPDELMDYGNTIPPTTHDSDYTVKEGQIFVAGDNRTESLDSRYFGPVNADNIIGKLSYRVLPVNKVQGF